jgi:hypothetical protein
VHTQGERCLGLGAWLETERKKNIWQRPTVWVISCRGVPWSLTITNKSWSAKTCWPDCPFTLGPRSAAIRLQEGDLRSMMRDWFVGWLVSWLDGWFGHCFTPTDTEAYKERLVTFYWHQRTSW